MIIFSQDKTKILNFDNIEVVGIGYPVESNDGKFQILVDTTNDNEFSIGEYKTEKRVKEVLQEIIKKYRDVTVVCDINNSKYEKYDLPKVYEMPSE